MTDFKRDIFVPDVAFTLEEASSEVDGKHIIGKVKGTFFMPDGMSRNKRYYPRSLWEKVLENTDVQSKMKDRRMLGTIGHDQPIDDKAVLEGKISHMVTNLSIDGDKGMGEALILDTPAGRSLNTLLRAGSKLFVSSRAYGKYEGNFNGMPKVDPESYKFETFDFVLDPGFLEANPNLVESLEIDIKGEKKMEKELLEKLMSENISLRNDLTKAIDESKKLKEDAEEAEKEGDSLEAKVADLEKRIADLEGKLAGKEGELADYKEIGEPEEVKKAIATSEALVNEYKTMGAPVEIKEALERSKALLNEYKALGTPAELDKAIDESVSQLKLYKELGTPAELDKAIDESVSQLKLYKELGTPEELERTMEGAVELIKQYKAFGSVKELEASFKKMESYVKKAKNESTEKKIKELASELGVSEAQVRELYGKVDETKIRELFKKTVESNKVTKTFKKPGESKTVTEGKKPTGTPKASLFESRVNRLMSNFQ